MGYKPSWARKVRQRFFLLSGLCVPFYLSIFDRRFYWFTIATRQIRVIFISCVIISYLLYPVLDVYTSSKHSAIAQNA